MSESRLCPPPASPVLDSGGAVRHRHSCRGRCAAFAFTRAEEAERDLGAPAIEIGIELDRGAEDRDRPAGRPRHRGVDGFARDGRAAKSHSNKPSCRRTRRPKPTIPTASSRPMKRSRRRMTIRNLHRQAQPSGEPAAAEETAAPAIEDTVQSYAGVDRAGNRRKRATRSGDVAEGAGRAFQQIQKLSGGPDAAERGGPRQLRAGPRRPRR